MLRILCLLLAFAGCAVLPASDPQVARGLDTTQAELAAISTRLDLEPGGRLPLDAEATERFETMLQGLQLSVWVAETRAETAPQSTRAAAGLVRDAVRTCRDAVLTLHRITGQVGLSRETFDETLTVQTCLTAGKMEQSLR
jgi:hypothetical protein